MAEENPLINTGNSQLDQKIQEWMTLDKYPSTLEEVRKLIHDKNYEELKSRMLSNLSFGTAGLRSSMGAGFSKFNDLTVIQASQGIAKYMLKTFSDAKQRGVVIGFDARHNSERLSQRAAAVFLSQGIKVYLFNNITPTPFVPYGVTWYKAVCGVMITASHNPKDDNGYKLTSPYDKAVSQCIKENSIPWTESWDLELSKYKELLINPYDEVFAAYFEDLKKYSHFGSLNKQTKITFTFTPMHGVGQIFAVKAFEVFKLPPFVSVIEQVYLYSCVFSSTTTGQRNDTLWSDMWSEMGKHHAADKMNPDPDFPTVKYPNPEEGKSALDLAMKAADANGSTVIIANDPDSDRTAIAEKQPNGRWKVFTGNETGALLGWWAFFCHKKDYPELYPGDNIYMVASTVSSKFLESMAKVEGFKFDETLTGFKWMGNQSYTRMQQGKTVLFAYEEAIGFMFGTNVLDKDGVSAGVVTAEMATYLNSQGLTLTQQLSRLYESYGVHLSNNSYYLCMLPPVIVKIFNRIRTLENGQYPSSCGGFKISGIRDLTTGYDSTKPDNKAVLPTSKTSQMITFYFENGCVATLRTSGTEPKIKYYTEITGKPGERVDMEAATSTLQRLVDSIVLEFLQPEVNDLTAKSD